MEVLRLHQNPLPLRRLALRRQWIRPVTPIAPKGYQIPLPVKEVLDCTQEYHLAFLLYTNIRLILKTMLTIANKQICYPLMQFFQEILPLLLAVTTSIHLTSSLAPVIIVNVAMR